MRRVATDVPRPIALVPTMGALHDGHLALVDRAREAVGPVGTLVASLFVNPKQFGPKEDYQTYPRPFARDRALLEARGCDVLYAPTTEAMYGPDASVSLQEDRLSVTMCGASRPGHFNGVCTVVAKLFNAVRPDVAVFGQKDYQQLAIIRRLVRDLDYPVEIIGAATVREPDGLALSSRNVYLSPEDRAQAPALYRTLQTAADGIRAGRWGTGEAVVAWMAARVGELSRARLDYAVAVDPDTLAPRGALQGPSLLALAAFFGNTRLIDNLLVD